VSDGALKTLKAITMSVDAANKGFNFGGLNVNCIIYERFLEMGRLNEIKYKYVS
jgi:hypothetical protein